MDSLLYMLEKPWKWDDEHARWTAAGCPDVMPEEPLYASDDE
jgi:hypothetical protein